MFAAPGIVPIPERTLHKASRKRPLEEGELAEHERRRKISFNIADALSADVDVVKCTLSNWKVPAWLYEALRVGYMDHYREHHEEEAASMSAKDFRLACRSHFARANIQLKLKLLKKILDDQETMSDRWTDVKMWLAKLTHMKELGVKALRQKDDTKIKVQTGLWVYNSERYVIHDLARAEGEEPWDPGALVARARDFDMVTATWKRFEPWAKEKARQLGAEVAVSMELSLSTYEATGVCKFHLNIALSRPVALRFANPWQFLEFEGAPAIFKPKMSQEEATRMAKKKGRSECWAQAAYYLQFPKLGMVYTGGSAQPYTSYQVRPRWVTEYLQAGANAFK